MGHHVDELLVGMVMQVAFIIFIIFHIYGQLDGQTMMVIIKAIRLTLVLQMRLREKDPEPDRQKHSLSQKVFQGLLSLVKGKEDKKRAACKNLNIL